MREIDVNKTLLMCKNIKTVDILNQDEEQQENTEEKWFLNQRDIVECMSAWNQFWSSDTWD